MKRIDELAKKLYDEVLNEYNIQGELNRKALSELLEEKLSKYNDDTQKVLEELIYTQLSDSIAAKAVDALIPDKLTLSEMLYNNSEKVSKESLALLTDGIKAKKTIQKISKKLYDGYDFNDNEVLDIKRKLPKYLQRELKKDKASQEFIKYVDNIKTKPLKTALKGIEDKLGEANSKALEKALKTVLEENSRYYATRIANTESHRARNLTRANDYLKNNDIEFVKLEMSSRHSIIDICDYHARLDLGYGRGIVPKDKMLTLPFHPNCMCRYKPYYKKVTKTKVKDEQKETMKQFSFNQQRQIVGSEEKLKEFHNGKDIYSLFNRIRPNYRLEKYVDVLKV